MTVPASRSDYGQPLNAGIGKSLVAAENLLVQLAQLIPWLNAKLVDEQPAGLPVDGQRLSWTAVGVQGEH